MPQIGYNEAGQPIGAAEWNRMQQQNNPSLFTKIGQGIKNAASSVGNAVSNVAQATGAVGTPGHYDYNPRFPGATQQKYEQYHNNALDRLNQGFSNPNGPNPSIDPLLKQAEMDYYTKIRPGIAESFTALGNQRSAGFPAALHTSGQEFATNLAGLKAKYNLDERNQLMGVAQQSPWENSYQPPTEGLASRALPLIGDIAAAYFNPASALGKAAIKGYQAYRGAGGQIFGSQQQDGQQYQQPYSQQQQQILPEQQSWLSGFGQRATQSGYKYTPEDIQQLQAILSGAGAASDFARTFKQPGSKRITFPRSPQDQAKYAGLIKAGVI